MNEIKHGYVNIETLDDYVRLARLFPDDYQTFRQTVHEAFTHHGAEARYVVRISLPRRVLVDEFHEIEAWCKEHISRRWCSHGNCTWAFETLADATYFKLRWTG